MSINRLLYDEERRNEFVQSGSSVLKTTLGLTGIAAVIANGMSKKSDRAYGKGKKVSTPGSNLGRAGVQLKESVQDAFEIRTRSELGSSKSFFDNLTADASRILNQTVSGAADQGLDDSAEAVRKAIAQEKTYLLTAVRDAISDLGIGGGSGLNEGLINQINEILEDKLERSGSVTQDVEDALRALASNVPGEQRVSQMKRFQALKENSRYFSGKTKAMGVARGFTKNRMQVGTFTEALEQGRALAGGSAGKFEQALANVNEVFTNRLNTLGGRVEGYTIIQEHQAQGIFPSIYYNIRDPQGRVQLDTVPLTLSSINGNRPILRTTSDMATPFATTSVLLENDLRTLLGGVSEAEAMNIIKGARPERYIRNYALQMIEKAGGSVSNLNVREIDQFQQFLRSFSISANKQSLTTGNKTTMTPGLRSSIQLQQTINSNQAIVMIPSSFTKKEAQEVPIKLGAMYPGLFDAPQSTSTPVREANVGALGALRGMNVNVLRNLNGSTITPFTLLRTMGLKDRGSLPLTAREAQFFGREDAIRSLILPGERRSVAGGVGQGQAFGRRGAISMIGENDQLLSVDPTVAKILKDNPNLGSVRGANYAGLIFLDPRAEFASGLAEGMAYYGSLPEVEIPIQKSVLDPESMQRPEFAFLRELIEKKKSGSGGGFYNAKNEQEVEKLFARFSSARGEIPLGEIDNRIVGIKRYQGLTGIRIGIEEVVEGGSTKYSITGSMSVAGEMQKLFGVLGRITGAGVVDEKQAVTALEQGLSAVEGGARLSGREIYDVYKSEFGGQIRNLVITGSGTISKATDFLKVAMYGGFRMLGGREDTLQRNIENLKIVERVQAINDVNARNRTNLILNARAMLQSIVDDGVRPSSTAMGMFLSPIKAFAEEGRFGLDDKSLKEVISGFETTLNLSGDEFSRAISTPVAPVAATMASGSPAQILARNMAKFEPRHANILYHGMRTFFGLNAEQSVRYLNDFVLRQEGIEYSGRYLPDIVSFARGFNTRLKDVLPSGNYATMSPDTFKDLSIQATTVETRQEKLDKFRQMLIESLDESRPTVLNISDVVDNPEALRKLKQEIPSGNIILPSAETVRGMKNYQITKSGQKENIDARLVANMKTMFDNIFNINTYGTQDELSNRIRVLGDVIGDTVDASALALRRSISGSVLGSLSAQGSGIILQEGLSNVTLPESVLANARTQMSKHRGYNIFMDTTAFIDSLNTFMGAATKTNKAIGYGEGDAGGQLLSKFKSFMFGHMDDSLDPVRGVFLRNPSIGALNMLPGIAASRLDIDKRYDIFQNLGAETKSFLSEIISPSFVKQNIGQAQEAYGQLGGYLSYTDAQGRNISFQEMLNMRDTSGLVAKDVSMSPEDLYRFEKAFEQNEGLRSNLASRRVAIHQERFNQALSNFYGANRPAGLNLSGNDLDSVNAILQQEMQANRSSTDLVDAQRSLRKIRSTMQDQNKVVKGLFNRAFQSVIDTYHIKHGVGGGKVVLPTFEAEISIKGRDKPMISRLDLGYSLIGDFDADTYQFFHETQSISQKAMSSEQEAIIDRITKASGRFGIIRNLINESFSGLADKMNSGEMSVARFTADQARKEIILKNVGGVDTQFKTVLLGMVENSLELADADKIRNREAAFAAEQIFDALSASANTQESGVIKSKKLKFATEIGQELAISIRSATTSGNTEEFEELFRNLIINNSQGLREGVEIDDIKLIGGYGDELQSVYRRSLKGGRISGEDILSGMVAGIKKAYHLGLGAVQSDSHLAKLMKSKGRMKGMFDATLAQLQAMEFGLLGVEEGRANTSRLDAIEEALDKAIATTSNAKAVIRRGLTGKGMAGIIGGGLVASYALGANYSTQALSGPDKFSDMKVRSEISSRALYNNFNRQHRDPSAAVLAAPTNLYERPIIENQMYVNKPSAISMSGEVRSMGDAQKVLQSIRSMGGRGHLSIQDNVTPRPNLADYYMRD